MKNLDKIVLDALNELEQRVYLGGDCQKKAALQCAIIRLVKEQDRDTRHACAEAIINIEGEITKDIAHNTCMNVRAV